MSFVQTDIADGVATVTLDDPDRRNALNAEMVDEIIATFDTVEADDAVGAVVVTGRAPAFCAGADLSHLGSSRRDGLRHIYEGFLRVASSTLPTIAAVNGPAVGAGMNLALACDVRIMGESGRFDTRFLKLGIHPGGGHTWMLRHLGGPQTLHAMVTFGQVVSGADAVRLGLAWSCVPDEDLLDAARSFARPAATAPRDLIKRVKATIGDMIEIPTHADAVDHELVAQVWSMTDPAFQASLAAQRAQISSRPD